MKEKLTKEEYKEIEKLVKYAIYSPNKKDAQNYIDKIQSYEIGLYGRANIILSELVCYVKDASGRVTNKESRIDSVNSKLFELEGYGVED